MSSRVSRRCRSSTCRRARVRALRPLERRRRIRHLPLPDAAGERAGLLLLARSSDAGRSPAAPSGSSRSRRSVTHRRAPDQVPDLVRAAAVLRSVARPLAQGAVLSGARAVDREARHGGPRAVSHRSRAGRHPADRARRRHATRRTATASSSSSRSRRWCTRISTADPSPETYDFLRHDFDALEQRYGGVVGTSFRTFPSFPQRFIERLAEQLPCDRDGVGVKVEPLARAAAAGALHRRRSARPRSSRRDSVAADDPQGSVQSDAASSASRRAPRNRGDQ